MTIIRLLVGLLGPLSFLVPQCAPPPSGSSDALFDPARPAETFAYAPATLDDGTMFYCGNPGYSIVEDWIIRRSASGSERAALKPTPGAWDSRHVCDPDIVRGRFVLNGGTYSWAMVYTGTQDPYSNGTMNRVGLAVSNDQVTWYRTGSPIIVPSANAGQWGVGQPAITSVDGNGRVMVFYTEAGQGVKVRYMDLSNAAAPVTLAGPWSSGLGHNADVAYDPGTDRFYATFPSRYDGAEPSYVAVEESLAWATGPDVWDGGVTTWTTVKRFVRDDKTHNSGLVHNAYGMLPSSNLIQVRLTASDALPWPSSLWDYRIVADSWAR